MDYEAILISLLDLLGTAVFASTGAMKGVQKSLDLFGICVLACCVGCGGGMLRDSLIGATPAAALTNWSYLTICCIVGIVVFKSCRHWSKVKDAIQIGDAIGLGVFTALGAIKGMDYGAGQTGIVLTGVLTACGGGLIRDLLVREVPAILYRDFYATAALVGGFIFLMLNALDFHWFINFLLTSMAVTALRLLAMRFKFRLPMPKCKRKLKYVKVNPPRNG